MDCNVCCEKFNKSTRIKCACIYCEFSACRACLVKYTLDSLQAPHCMNCKKFFTKESLSEYFTASFIKGPLKEHEENVIFDRENGLLIETMPYVELKKKVEANYEIQLNFEKQKAKLYQEINKIDRQIVKITNFQNRFITTINSEQGINGPGALQVHENYDTEPGETEVVKKEPKKFTRRCPAKDCRGFLGQDWKCGVCEVVICKECNEPFCENHICDPECLENMKLINKDSKPCPECGEFTFRIEGCFMMWCTICHTPWDWKTGEKLANENIHNPHYFEFLRKNGNLQQQTRRAGECGFDHVQFIRSLSNFQQNLREYIINLYRIKEHIRLHEIPMNNRTYSNPVVFNRKLRLRYILKEIEMDEFKKEIRINEKKIIKSRDFTDILNMFVNASNDVFMNIWNFFFEHHEYPLRRKHVDEQSQILHNLVIYFNQCMENHGKFYKIVYPGISEDGSRYYRNIVREIV